MWPMLTDVILQGGALGPRAALSVSAVSTLFPAGHESWATNITKLIKKCAVEQIQFSIQKLTPKSANKTVGGMTDDLIPSMSSHVVPDII